MSASPTFCNKHLNLFFSASSIGPRPPSPEPDRGGCIVYICAGLGYLDACMFLGLAAQPWRIASRTLTLQRAIIFPFVITASGRRFPYNRERPHSPPPPWRAATRISNFLFLHCPPPTGGPREAFKTKKILGCRAKEGSDRL